MGVMDREKVIKALETCRKTDCANCEYSTEVCLIDEIISDALALLKEQGSQKFLVEENGKITPLPIVFPNCPLKEYEKKQITLHKKHVITWGRNDEFSMRKLYEAICETLLDEGELFIARTDDHEKVEFVFYVADGVKRNE